MKFLISMTDIEGEWDALPAAEQDRILAAHDEFKRALRAANRYVDVFHLHPRSTARTVRMDSAGNFTDTDAPFSDAREYIGGFYVIEADSIDEAVEWARKGRFMVGANEVRQVWE